MALVTRKILHKNGDGSIVEAEIGAKAENVLEDENDRFVTDAEKTSWNGKVDSSGGNIANTKVSEFAASSTQWPVPAAGESPKTLWGKVKKFTEDFKNWMSGVCLIGQIVNNCVTNNANLPLSAAQGKVLMDLYTVLNTKQNQLENNLDGTVLYSSTAGSQESGDYPISDSVNNYRYIDVILQDLSINTNYTTVRLYKGYYSYQVMRPYADNNNSDIFQTYWRYIGFNNVIMTLGIGIYRDNNAATWTELNNILLVRKVIGYK